MKRLMRFLLSGMVLLVLSTPLLASPVVEDMSDIEVADYAVQLCAILNSIREKQLCGLDDSACVRAELSRQGESYDDIQAVHKRLLIMLGSIH